MTGPGPRLGLGPGPRTGTRFSQGPELGPGPGPGPGLGPGPRTGQGPAIRFKKKLKVALTTFLNLKFQ